MKNCKLSVNLRVGESLDIGGGLVFVKLEEKSGQRARLVLEFRERTDVVKLPGSRAQMKEARAALGPY